MKKTFLKKARIAGAVMLATAGLTAGTVAQAESLLVPLVMSGFGYTTYLNFKVGSNIGDPTANNIHYTWLKKGVTPGSLRALGTPCSITNSMGQMTPHDMMFQATNSVIPATPHGIHLDNSTPSAYTATPFFGMLVLDDGGVQGGSGTPEGDMSGFAYIVNPALGIVQDYKLLNNHHSTRSGDFAAGFISKKVVDLAWMGSAIGVFPGSRIQTGWTAMVTGKDMSKHGAGYSSVYDASVAISQAPLAGQDSPQDIMGGVGVYDNDEVYTSGDVSTNVTCMGSFTRANLMDAQLLLNTRNGGWARVSIGASDGASGTIPHTAKGAIVYRADLLNNIPGMLGPGNVTMQVETGGHLAGGANNHANRPY